MEDEEVGKALEKSYKKQGIKVMTKTKVVETKTTDAGVEIKVEGKKEETLTADVCLVAIGVSPVIPGGKEIRKTDCARLLILHQLGGAYFDLDLVPHRAVQSFLHDPGEVHILFHLGQAGPEPVIRLADL